ncbi:glycoside hydrolase [Bacillus cereus]
MKKKMNKLALPILMSSICLTLPSLSYAQQKDFTIEVQNEVSQYKNFTFDVNPETSEIFVEKDGVRESASLPLPKKKIENLIKKADYISWSYPDDQVNVKIEKKDSYLNIKLQSTKSEGTNEFTWPKVSADSYTLPLWEGKNIPSNDSYWKQFLKDQDFSFIESFSMRFFALNKAKYSIMYIADNMYNDNIHFTADSDSNIQFSFTHQYPSINKNKEYGFRLYVTDKNPVSMANIYKNYIKEKGEFKTLEEKAKANPNIRKLYGAPHIYFWDHSGIAVENIKWDTFTQKMDEKFTNWIAQLLQANTEDGSKDFVTAMQDIKMQKNINESQKKIIVNAINEVLKLEQLYNQGIFSNLDAQTNEIFKKGIQNLSEQELYTLNKGLIKSKLTDAVDEVSKWEQKETTDVLIDMKKSGIKKAWIGLPNWANGLMNPQMVEEANRMGYLIGPYDSYHSIHEVGSREWNTASFKDKTLYENATVSNEKGEKIEGFAGKGRKLNPTLSLPSVKERVGDILHNNIPFNSWFVDTDATGEIHDDYSPNHITTQEQDIKARLQRMKYISEEKHMVVGSEGGNDFASSTIAFAHGIETPGIWADFDMKDKQSPYYVGGYKFTSPNGAVPELNGKTIPIKPIYKNIYNNPVYSVPLYKLVYNDSIITTHQWGWGSFRIKDEIGNRMLSEMLYNVPPLYHIDKNEWEKSKSIITSYLKIWSPFHEKAVTKPMTNFEVLSENQQVQSTTFGDDMKVIVNFSSQDFKYNNEIIKAKTAILYDGEKKSVLEVPKY